jgi:phosphoribosyl 1,2-cyclic phosphate phosphodiesterase
MGVPVLGCSCSVCLSSSRYNKRRRSAALLSIADKKILIDAGPDIREQLLDLNLKNLSGAIITHSHFDHIAGLDDLKAYSFAQKSKIPLLLSEATFDELSLRHHYLMDENQDRKQGLFFDFQLIPSSFCTIDFVGVEIDILSFVQNHMPVNGFKVGNLAFVSDIKEYSQQLLDSISGIEILIVSALRQTSSPMHFSIDEAVAFSKKVGAKKTYLTHMAHEVDYDIHSSLLPSGVQFAFDGLEIPIQYDRGLS